MSRAHQPLPAFEDPPVIETLLGVQFAPLELLSVLHFGLFWARIRGRYPRQEIHPSLDPTFEVFERRGVGLQFGVQPIPEPPLRCWFIDGTQAHLIQVQRDRFIRNWRKRSPQERYPRYDALRPAFREDWDLFCRFLQEDQLGIPEVNQCEVTYVNHIAIGQGWDSYGEAHRIVKLLSRMASPEFLPDPEIIRMDASFLIPEKQGRLHVSLQPVISRPLNKEVLQLTLTARGKPASSSPEDILNWFDLGHEWVVRGFADITTAEMQTVWRRTS